MKYESEAPEERLEKGCGEEESSPWRNLCGQKTLHLCSFSMSALLSLLFISRTITEPVTRSARVLYRLRNHTESKYERAGPARILDRAHFYWEQPGTGVLNRTAGPATRLYLVDGSFQFQTSYLRQPRRLILRSPLMWLLSKTLATN